VAHLFWAERRLFGQSGFLGQSPLDEAIRMLESSEKTTDEIAAAASQLDFDVSEALDNIRKQCGVA